ncbi:immunoglobulin superfamily member 1-like, partial [Scyliorhinus torazame]|uniref:immunoglobulin superfamily member 1-like n=1 Tax=Scyliorhinus torazame TaxID=75743 RepID=UPI003B5B5378
APARPTLYLQPQVPVFVRGESVELVCVAEGARRGRRFSLSRLGAEEPLQTQRAQSWSKFVVFQLREEVAIGTQVYTCSYWAWAPGSDVLSAQSETVAVTVIERAPKPTIAPEGAYRTFVEGEAVRIACTAPWALTNATFLLYQGTEDEASASATSTPGSNATTFDTGGGAGVGRRDYSCAYVTEVSERRIESQRSETVRIRVESRLTKPNLDGVNITFQVGDTVRLVCEGGIEDWLNTFLLYQGVAEEPLMSGKPIFARAAVTFDVTDALAHGTETFSCASRRDLSGRRVLSQRSHMLEVSAHDPLSKPELTMNVRTGIYWKGQSLQMTCRGDVHGPRVYFSFFRDGQPAMTREPHSFPIVQILGSNRAGVYQCSYAMDTPGRWFQSPLSDGVRVTEIGYLRRPSIALAGGRGGGSEGGRSVTCRAPVRETGRKFDLYRSGDGRPVLSRKARPGSPTVTFDLEGLLRSGTGYYQCAYRSEHGGQERVSERSDRLEIIN